MDDWLFQPWMLRADWREDTRPALVVDLATWPSDQPFDPLPPAPLIGIGPRDHPQSQYLDVLLEPPFTLAPLIRAIARNPHACATLVQLLRTTRSLPPAEALTAESFAFAMLQAGSEHAAWLANRDPAAPLAPGMLHLNRSGTTLDLLLDRPEARNGIDRAMRDALFDAFTLAALDESIAHVRLRAIGRCFSMGADLEEFGTTRDPVMAHAIRMRTLPARALLARMTIADVHVQGACVGAGLELAAFAARLTATPEAWFQLPEASMGIVPGAGGTVSIPLRVGRQRAALLMLSGRRIGARTALDWGLVDAIVKEGTIDDGRTDMCGGKIVG